MKRRKFGHHLIDQRVEGSKIGCIFIVATAVGGGTGIRRPGLEVITKLLKSPTLVHSVAFGAAQDAGTFVPKFLDLGDGQIFFPNPHKGVGL